MRGTPVCEYTESKNDRFNIMLRRRSRLPLAGGIRRCPGFRHCQSMLDAFGDHLASCPSTGRLKRRGTAFERVYRPLWNESTAREREQPFVTELIRAIRRTRASRTLSCAVSRWDAVSRL